MNDSTGPERWGARVMLLTRGFYCDVVTAILHYQTVESLTSFFPGLAQVVPETRGVSD